MTNKQYILFEEFKDEFQRQDEWSYPKGFMYDMWNDLEQDFIHLARKFFLSANALLDEVNNNKIPDYEVSNPIFFLYRHSIELYLKSIIQKKIMKFLALMIY